MKQYLWNIAVGIDQLANTIIGGTPDTTISGRCWYHGYISSNPSTLARIAVEFIDMLFAPFEYEHCKKSFEADEEY